MKSKLLPIKLDSYKPLREIVCDTLRQAIVDGVFKPGERLMEIKLADEMGVSRTPVREAIRKLEIEGFVELVPRRGTYVSDISVKDITDVYEIRIVLDVLAAVLSTERITPEEINKMRSLLDDIDAHIKKGEFDQIVEADSAFHDVLYQASHNQRLVMMINNLRDQFTRLRMRSMKYPGRLKNTQREHRELVDAIAARDIERAKATVCSHLENAEATLLAAVREHIG